MAKKINEWTGPHKIAISRITGNDPKRMAKGKIKWGHSRDPIYIIRSGWGSYRMHDGNARLGKAIRKNKRTISAYIRK